MAQSRKIPGLTAGFLVLALAGTAQASAAGSLRAPGRGAPGDYFGAAVAVTRTSIVAGAPGANDATGLAHVYAFVGKAWRAQGTLTDPADVTGDEFGNAVSISGDTIVIGAPGANDARGQAYIYQRSGVRWHRIWTLNDPNGAIGDEFGSGVAVTGGVVIVGAPGTRNGVFGPKSAGTTYVYTHRTFWAVRLKLADPQNLAEDFFGSALAVAGATLIVGATGVNNHSGAAYIYTGKGVTWHLQAKLPDPSRIVDDFFGDAVAISGAIAVIGAPASVNIAGLAYIYGRTGSTWHRLARLTDPRDASSDWFGAAVAISDSKTGVKVMVGDPHSEKLRCGTAYEFTRPKKAWRVREVVANPGCTRNDWFGAAIGMAGQTAVIGAFGKNNNAGTVYFIKVP